MLGSKASPALGPQGAGLASHGVVLSSMRNTITEMAVTTVTTTGECPPPLVGATITTVGTKIYLFAGRLTEPRILTNDLYILDLTTYAWRKVRLQLSPESEAWLSTAAQHKPEHVLQLIRPRYFHSAVVYGHQIVYFGGMGRLRPHAQEVGVLSDVLIFDTATLQWTIPKMTTGSPPPRYAHLCTLLDNDHMLIMGGQDLDTDYLGDLHVLDLKTMGWCLSRHLNRNVGIYRSIVAYDDHHRRAIVYSNYNFNDVKRSLHFISDPNWRLTDRSDAMVGPVLPHGLRFPSSVLLGPHLILTGTHIGRDFPSFRIWALDLRTCTWQEISCGSLFEKGSWNKGALCADLNRFYVFGHQSRSLLHDYNARQLNFNHIRVITLDAFGLHHPVEPMYTTPYQELGLSLMESPALANVTLVTLDGLQLACNAFVLSARWPHFKRLFAPSSDATKPHASLHSTLAPTQLPMGFTVRIPETYDVANQFVRYLHTGALDVSLSTALLTALLVAAAAYQMPRLQGLCAAELHGRLALDTSPLIFEGATRADHQGLRVRALLYMFDRRDALLRKHIEVLQGLRDETQKEILTYFPEINKHYRKRSNTAISHQSTSSTASVVSGPHSLPTQQLHYHDGSGGTSAGSSLSTTPTSLRPKLHAAFTAMPAVLESPTEHEYSTSPKPTPPPHPGVGPTSASLSLARSLDDPGVAGGSTNSESTAMAFAIKPPPSPQLGGKPKSASGTKSPRQRNRLLKLTLGSTHGFFHPNSSTSPSTATPTFGLHDVMTPRTATPGTHAMDKSDRSAGKPLSAHSTGSSTTPSSSHFSVNFTNPFKRPFRRSGKKANKSPETPSIPAATQESPRSDAKGPLNCSTTHSGVGSQPPVIPLPSHSYSPISPGPFHSPSLSSSNSPNDPLHGFPPSLSRKQSNLSLGQPAYSTYQSTSSPQLQPVPIPIHGAPSPMTTTPPSHPSNSPSPNKPPTSPTADGTDDASPNSKNQYSIYVM
ncbi:hypothetical protein H4R34_001638 [Dimargaris verticillata]|uniref:BTB domain-containing protein n=1 Tax=Dimargaris verticillata TaxID=2761393 RepID=A0A9W8B5R3_9FUNG|nr:hypothetical protein H4R34_001638 [Dimargaris verticillata]